MINFRIEVISLHSILLTSLWSYQFTHAYILHQISNNKIVTWMWLIYQWLWHRQCILSFRWYFRYWSGLAKLKSMDFTHILWLNELLLDTLNYLDMNNAITISMPEISIVVHLKCLAISRGVANSFNREL